jgi:hypothetical protein
MVHEQNLQHVSRVCQRFLADKFQVAMELSAILELVREVSRTLDPRLDLEEANKAIIVKVKDTVLSARAHMESAVPSAAVLDEIPPLPQQASSTGNADEDDFYKRLQDLETQRSMPPPSSAPVVPSPLMSPPQLTAPTAPTGIAAAGPNVVYLPATASPARYHRPILINGSDRMWEYFTKRSTLVWPGPIKGSSTILVALMLPKACAGMTPIVSVEITGAAGNSVETVCILRDTGPVWDRWVPCGEALLKTLACPWTIKLRDNFLRPLELGEDTQVIKQSVKLQNGNTKIMLEFRAPLQLSMSRGMRIRVKPAAGGASCDGEFDTTVINYDETSNAAEIPFHDAALANARVCNLHMQASLVLSVPTATPPTQTPMQ